MSRKFPLHNIHVALSELDEAGSIKADLQQILANHGSLFAGDDKVRKYVERHFPKSGLDTLTLQEVVNGLDVVVKSYNAEPKFYERDNVQDKHGARVSALIDGIKSYITDGNTTLKKLSKRSHHDPPHDGLTGFMRAQGLISRDDTVIVSGGEAAQIYIVNGAEAHEVSRLNSWFLWNVDSGGMFSPSETGRGESRSYHFECKIDLGEVHALKQDVASFKDKANTAIGKAFAQGTDLATKVREEFPRLGVNQMLGEALRLVRYAEESRYYSGGSIEKGDLLSYEHEKDGPVMGVTRIINANQITNNDYMPSGGINVDLLWQFLQPRTLSEVHNFQTTLATTQARIDELERTFTDFFTGEVSARGEKRSPYNIFRWFFYDWDCSKVGCYGYTDHVKYDPNNMLGGIDWVATTTTQLAEQNPHFRRIQQAAEAFRASGAYAEFQKLIGGSSSGFGKGGFPDDEMFMSGKHRDFERYYHGSGVYGGVRDIRNGGREGSFTKKALEISRRHSGAVYDLEDALREFEYVMVWAKYFNNAPVTTAVPDISHTNQAISIREGRNLPLVLSKDEPQRTVVSNDVDFNAEQYTIMITGANGGGKTQLLEMIANNTIFAHKGLRVFASDMALPALGAFEYGVNLSVHGESASSYQNEVRKLMGFLSRLEEDRLPGDKGLVILDEPFRGTDAQDAIPLLVGLMKYLEQRGVYFAYSTHFNHIGELDSMLREEGIHVGIYTMDRERFKLKAGVGRSEGIDVAEKLHLDSEIVGYAHDVVRQAEDSRIRLTQPTLRSKDSSQTFRLLSAKDLEELGIYKEVDRLEDWGRHYQVASATRCFAEHSILRSDEYVSDGDRQYLPAMRPDSAQAFMDVFTKSLSDEERKTRVDTLDRLVGGTNPLYRRFEGNVDTLKEFMTLFSLYQRKKRKGVEGIFEVMKAGIDFGISAAREMQDEKIQYERFLSTAEKNTIASGFSSLRDLTDVVKNNNLAACNDDVRVVESFLASDAYRELSEFVSEYRFLEEGRFDGKPASETFTMDNWKDWVNLCVDYEADLIKVHEAVLRLNFYNVAARTIKEKGWQKVENNDQGKIEIKTGRNTRLEYIVDEVTPVDVELDPEKPINIISGTNGGGKTQYLQLVGSMLYFNRQLGYVPAESARIGNASFLYTMLSTAEHGQEQSSFQNEVSRIREGIELYKAAGEPTNGVVLLDEPFKGTSEEEAIPLLSGLVKYFERRGVQVVFSTHFSGLFDYLDRLYNSSRVAYKPLFVDYFSSQDRFKVKTGKGSSAGIRVAEEMGLPQEIIDTAKTVYRRLHS